MQGEQNLPVKTKQPPKAKKGKLDRKEWDFRKIPKPEIEACFIYEYARGLASRSPQTLDLFTQGQAGRSAGKKTPQFSEGRKVCQEFRKTMTDCFPDFLYLYGDWFPDTSWQGLDQKVRSELVKEVNYGRQHRWNSLPVRKLSIERDSFEINWNYPDAELKRAFAKWLSEQRKGREKGELTEIKYKPKGRGGFSDRLNWLGALRVRKHYRTGQLVDYGETELKVPAPYSHSPDLYKNAKKADHLLKMMLNG
jgi:hypothetical protein